jgi:hypothetical protein
MIKQLLTISLCILFIHNSIAQFAPPQGQPGNTAIYKDSSILIAWATTCTLERGLMDISQPSLGLATAGQAALAVGPAGNAQTVSLGDSGVATLTFEYPIRNGAGADFVVFENAFSATFLELAFVEVSSDGQNFVRFPAISNTDTSTQVGSFGAVDATQIYNLAGKYRANYGTPFDLGDLLADSLVLDFDQITHVRIVDAIGTMQPAYASRDSRGIKVNDPWRTPFSSGGFDLDAVGVIHNNTNIAVQYIADNFIKLYPNPIQVGQEIFIENADKLAEYSIRLYTLSGQLVLVDNNSPEVITTQGLIPGCYVLTLQTSEKSFVQKFFVR